MNAARHLALSTIALLLPAFAQTQTPGENSASDKLSRLWSYNGSWKITKTGKGSKSTDELVNRCVHLGGYFTCSQVVNAQASALLVFVPTADANVFTTQTIKPDGRAAGKGTLQVNGSTWTFLSSWNQGAGHITYYRTVNNFADATHLHFQQQESSDNKNWQTVSEGDELRTAAGKTVVLK